MPAIMGRGSVASDMGMVSFDAVVEMQVVLTILAIVLATDVDCARGGRVTIRNAGFGFVVKSQCVQG